MFGWRFYPKLDHKCINWSWRSFYSTCDLNIWAILSDKVMLETTFPSLQFSKPCCWIWSLISELLSCHLWHVEMRETISLITKQNMIISTKETIVWLKYKILINRSVMDNLCLTESEFSLVMFSWKLPTKMSQ